MERGERIGHDAQQGPAFEGRQLVRGQQARGGAVYRQSGGVSREVDCVDADDLYEVCA